MNIDELTIGQVKEIMSLVPSNTTPKLDNGMVGKYVIVRCKDAGVHAGILEKHEGRECVLRNSRRLWYWKPANGKWLNAVATYGLHEDSKLSVVVARIHLTEDCEIIQCTDTAKISIESMKADG